jgi:hypothetical protein
MAQQREERLSAVRGFPSQTSHTLSALSGGAFVILILVSFLLAVDLPTYHNSPLKFVAYYSDNQSKLQISLLLSAFAAFWLAWFLGVLNWLYQGAERRARGFVRAAPIAFAGGISGLAMAAAAGMAEVTAIETVDSVPPSVTRMLGLMHSYGLTWATVLLSVFLLSSFFIVRVTQVLPAWLGILALLGTVLGFFQAVVILSPGNDNGVFGVVGIAWFAVFLVYIFFASVNLARRAETALLAG